MAGPEANELLESYRFQTQLIHHHVEGVTDAESLLQLPFEANCLNWIVGHIVSRCHSALEALGAEPLWSDELLSRYQSGSKPITSPEEAYPFTTILADLERSVQKLQTSLANATEDTLEATVVNDRGEKPAREHLEGFLWHETYHIGQLDILQAFIKSNRA